MSCPMRKACSLVFPGRCMKSESVSPYTTCAPHFFDPSIIRTALNAMLETKLRDVERMYLLQSLPATLHNAVCNLNSRHAARKGGTRVPVRDISDVFETKLPSIQDSSEHLPVMTLSARWSTLSPRLLTLSSLTLFMACFTITRVSNSSVNMRLRRPLRTSDFT